MRRARYLRAQDYARRTFTTNCLSDGRGSWINLPPAAINHVREYVALAWRKGYETALRDEKRGGDRG